MQQEGETTRPGPSQRKYADSIESLVRNKIQKTKIDMANEVIDAGRFDMSTTQEERKETLEALLQARILCLEAPTTKNKATEGRDALCFLSSQDPITLVRRTISPATRPPSRRLTSFWWSFVQDEERLKKAVNKVPTAAEMNRMLARSPQEVDMFDKMDARTDWPTIPSGPLHPLAPALPIHPLQTSLLLRALDVGSGVLCVGSAFQLTGNLICFLHCNPFLMSTDGETGGLVQTWTACLNGSCTLRRRWRR